MRKSFRVLAYKDSAGFFDKSGTQRTISCNHYREGDMGMTVVGEIVPLPTSSVPPPLPGTEFEHKTVLVPQTAEFPSPTAFGDVGFKAVTKIKDLDTLITTYVDTADYNTRFGDCNDCCIPAPCVAPATVVTNVTSSSATISWPLPIGATGFEWILSTPVGGACIIPSVHGTFLDTNTINLTGLAKLTVYCFCVRTICGLGIHSEYSCIRFITS